MVQIMAIETQGSEGSRNNARARWIVSSAPSLHVPAVGFTGDHLRFRAISF